MTSAGTPTSTRSVTSSVAGGALAGLVAGLPLGIIMQARDAMMGLKLIDLVGDLVADPSTSLGWLVHLFNSALFGVVFVLIFSRLLTWQRRGVAMLLGIAYGLAWWVVGALWVMPAWLGMSEMIFEVGDNQWWSLVGHLIYGLLLVPVYLLLRARLTR